MKRIVDGGKIALALIAGLTLTASSHLVSAVDAQLDVVVEKSVMLPTRDAVRLATDIYLPAKEATAVREKLPTILERTPYDKEGSGKTGRYYATRGYAFVTVRVASYIFG